MLSLPQVFFPWTLHIHLGAWAYAGQTGRLHDAAAYFSGLGAVWDAVWIAYGLFSWRVLTRSYFEQHIYPADKFWTVANPGPLPQIWYFSVNNSVWLVPSGKEPPRPVGTVRKTRGL